MIEPYQYSELVYFPPNHEIEERILTKLNKRPLTSHELSHYLGLGVHNIIYWLNILEKKGKIISIENGHVFYKIKRELNRKVDLLPGVYRKNSKIPQLPSFYYAINKFSGYQEIFFLKLITKCDPHFKELYNKSLIFK